MAEVWEMSAADSWIGRYGSLGIWIAGVTDAEYLSENVRLVPPALTFVGTKPVLVSVNPSTAQKAIHKPDGLSKIQAMIYGYGDTWDIVLAIPEKEHRLTLYFYDHYGTGLASLKLEILTPGGVSLGPPITVAEYVNGIYATSTIPGSCIVRITKVFGGSGITGIFLDPPLGPPPDTTAPLLVGAVDESGALFTVTSNEPISGSTGLILSGQFGGGAVADQPIYVIPTAFESETETTRTYRITRSRPVYKGESIALTYQGGDIRDAAGNALAQFAGLGVQNDSQSPAPVWQVLDRRVIGQSDAHGIRTCTTLEALLWPEG